MNSQIYDFDDESDKSNEALTKADASIGEIERQRAEIAERRRALAEPTHKVVVANPSGMYHKTTLGGVLVNANFQAADADALAGLLSLDAADFIKRFANASASKPNTRAGAIIADMIDVGGRELGGLGLYAEWQRRLNLFLEDRQEWLARDEDLRLNGAWRDAAMTADQRWLIRVTCRVLKIEMPGHLLRGQAADWLENTGANLNYGDFV